MAEKTIFTLDQQKNLNKIANNYGLGHQIFKLCEESNELSAATIRWKLCDPRAQGCSGMYSKVNDFVNELADVLVVSEQVKMLIAQDPQILADVQIAADRKIKRQLQRMEAENNVC